MKYDMHCHCKEGSIDATLGIIPHAMMLKLRGYSGMVITDHDSYKGFNYYDIMRKCGKLSRVLEDFHVFKGIEYDTRDAGHVIVILPDGVNLPILEKKGLKLDILEKLVHGHGGIMGAAHPYGNGYIAITNTRLYKKNPEVLKKFDFIEAYNSTLNSHKNSMAYALAKHVDLPMTAGTDAHNVLRVGTAYTAFKREMTCNNDIIEYIKNRELTKPVGLFHPGLLKKKNPVIRRLGIWGYWIYNKLGMIFKTHGRRKMIYSLDLEEIRQRYLDEKKHVKELRRS